VLRRLIPRGPVLVNLGRSPLNAAVVFFYPKLNSSPPVEGVPTAYCLSSSPRPNHPFLGACRLHRPFFFFHTIPRSPLPFSPSFYRGPPPIFSFFLRIVVSVAANDFSTLPSVSETRNCQFFPHAFLSPPLSVSRDPLEPFGGLLVEYRELSTLGF